MTSPQSSGVQLGSAYGSITIDDNIDSAISRATGKFDNALTAIGGRMQQLGSQMSNIGGKLTLATAPLAAFGIAGVRTAASYEDALREIQVRAGLTADELAMVVDKTKEIGLESQYGPAQAADAFLQLLTSGSSVAEAMEQVDAVILGAAASGAELGYTADVLTDVLAAFGLEASQSADVMQTLIDATGASSADFNSIADAFANVGPVARNFGLSVEETAAALAIFAESSIKGAEGGTQLKTVLTQLQSPKARQELDRLGVSLTDAQGNIRPLNDIIVDLNASMDDMTQAERNQVIQELAGSYGQMGLSALLAEGGLSEMTAEMSRQAALSDIANAKMDTFNGQIQFLRGSIELLMIDAMTPLMNALRPMVEWVAALVGQLREWIVANPELTNRIVQILAVVTALGPALVILGQVIGFIGGAISGLGVLFGVLLSPIGLVIAAVVALGAAWHTNFMGIRDFAIPLFAELWTWLQEKIPIAIQTAADFWTSTLWPALQNVWLFMTTYIFPAFAEAVLWLLERLPGALQASADFWNNTLAPAIKTVWGWIRQFLDIVGGPEFATYLVVAAALVWGLSAAFGAVTAAIGLLSIALSPLGLALIVGGLLVLAYQNNWLGFKTFIDTQVRPSLEKIWQLIQDISTTMRQANFAVGNPLGLQSNIDVRPAGHGTTPEGGIWASAGGPSRSNPNGNAGHGTTPQGGIWASAIPGFATGTNYLPQDMLIMAHEGEAIIPKEFNPAAGGSGMGGGMTIEPGAFVIYANSEEEGRAAMRGAWPELENLLRST